MCIRDRFYWLYYHHPLGIPKEFYLVLGLLCLLYLHILSGATTAIQPGAVIYFVVLFTQPVNTYIGYTIARVIDTGIGVIFSLVLNFLLPSKLDKRNGFDFPHTFQRWFKSNQRPSNERYPLDPVSYTHLDVYKRQYVTPSAQVELPLLPGKCFLTGISVV